MTSQMQDIVDAIADGIITAIPGLATAPCHRYAPWSPALLQARAGEREWAVYPVAEGENRTVLATGFHELNQVYEVLVWEDASEEGTRRIDDEAANLEWLQLFQDVREWFYHDSRQVLGGGNVVLTWYERGEFIAALSNVRTFAIRVAVTIHQPFTTA